VDDFEGESVCRLADIEVSSTKTEVCDCKRKQETIWYNKSAIITNKGGDINKSAKLQGAWEISRYRGVRWLQYTLYVFRFLVLTAPL